MELTVLGCSGSYGAPAGGACSGYLVRAGDANIWMDCGNGTFANLHEHIDPGDLSAVVITHGHADHCVDIYGLHVMYRYGLEMSGLPVYAPEGLEPILAELVGDFGDTGRFPYGPKPAGEVLKYSVQIADVLLEHDVKMIVVA